jgi:hypothetical protein
MSPETESSLFVLPEDLSDWNTYPPEAPSPRSNTSHSIGGTLNIPSRCVNTNTELCTGILEVSGESPCRFCMASRLLVRVGSTSLAEQAKETETPRSRSRRDTQWKTFGQVRVSFGRVFVGQFFLLRRGSGGSTPHNHVHHNSNLSECGTADSPGSKRSCRRHTLVGGRRL